MEKIKKLINQGSSDELTEAQQASKMAVAFMVREGVSFEDLLKYKEELYIDGLMLTARAYAKRTTKTQPEAQKLSAQLYKQINEAYHPSLKTEYKTNFSTNNQEKARLQREQEKLDRKAKELKEKEANIFRREQQRTSQPAEELFYETDSEAEYQPRQTNRSHNINSANYFLRMLVKHPVLTARLFFKSLISALVVSFVFMILVFILSIVFNMDLTFNLSYLAMYEGLVFILLIAYTLVNIQGWYPSE